MKLKGIAVVALAAIGTSAYAQSSVTLYGVIDSGLLYQSTSAASFSPAAKNLGKVYRYKDGGIYSSLWGMKGTEDIGGGYHVNFRLQGVFDSGTGKFGLSDTPGVAAQFNQVATVGLSGPFGSVNLGRQIVPMAYAMAETDVRSGQYFGSILTAWLGMNTAAGWPGTSTNGPIGALYDSNAIVYQSPSFGGVSGALEYAPGGVAGSFQGGTRESAVLKYSNYGLKLSAVYYNGHDTNPGPTTVPTGLDNNRFWYLGALYTIKGFSVSASYSNGKNPAHSNLVDLDLYSVGLGYRFTPAFQVTSGLYYLKDKNNSANKSTEIAAGAEYSLSKATLVYAQVGYVNNKGNATTTITYGAPVAPRMGTTAVNIGLRHSF
ncbi:MULTISPECIES: porin [Paraburkholderia]|jgi:predicted porin|uniref:Porin n=1 Tax=Paraburkholderia madseniana TaxID=2599607 RepID=A0A6N6W960_9BURK|nr:MULTISPECIES: porin [Paraburkholderia]KAE8756986.1 porin [Paraburkholderia madseniana]MCX4176151.1 porin [Paraburkholderia madseniana]MDQ6464145.1 porin [Paraburkholderia madseniana]